MPLCSRCEKHVARAPVDGVSLNAITLTFKDARTERAFLQHSVEGLRASFFWSGATVCVITAVTLLVRHSTLPADDPTKSRDEELMVGGVTVLGALLHMMLSQFRWAFRRIDFEKLEFLLVFDAMGLQCMFVLMQPVYLHMLLGLETFYHDQSLLLLALVSVTAGLHLQLPVRWHAMIPAQLSCLLAYALPNMLFETGTNTMMHSIVLGGVVCIMSQGKRTVQIQQRQNFGYLIAERTQRVKSEFKLSRMMAEGSHGWGEEEVLSPRGSTRESVPTTAETSRRFNIVDEDGESLLSGIRELGQREQWLVSPRELTWKTDDILGSGGFGIVLKGYYQGIGVAVKVPKAAPQTLQSRKHLIELCNELQILRRLRHPNIVGFYGALLDEGHNDLALVLELVQGASLQAFVVGSPGEAERAEVLCGIGCALQYLHSRQPRVVHGDLKSTNIFVESSQSGSGQQHVAKLLDFGFARRMTKHARPMGGTLRWLAPEVMQVGHGPDTASDVFSFGRIAFYVVTGRIPLDGLHRTRIQRDLQAGIVPQLDWPVEEQAGDYQRIIDQCNEANHRLRPHIEQVQNVLISIWRRCGGEPTSCIREAEPDLHEELCAARRAAEALQQAASSAAEAPPRCPTEPPAPAPLPREPTGCRREAPALALRYPGLRITPVSTQINLVAEALARCNYVLDSPSPCCDFHGSVRNLLLLVQGFRATECKDPQAGAVRQCASCGAILSPGGGGGACGVHGGAKGGPAAAQCDHCGGEVTSAGVSHEVVEV